MTTQDELDDRAKAVLETRARALARPLAEAPSPDAMAVVSVRLAREHYAFEAAHVLEVMPLAELTPLPGAEPPVFAVTTWRGELLLLLDIRPSLGLSAAALNDLRHVVVLDGGTTPVGILVDEVLEMATIRRASVRPLGLPGGAARDLVRGVTDDALIVLDSGALTRTTD